MFIKGQGVVELGCVTFRGGRRAISCGTDVEAASVPLRRVLFLRSLRQQQWHARCLLEGRWLHGMQHVHDCSAVDFGGASTELSRADSSNRGSPAFLFCIFRIIKVVSHGTSFSSVIR